MTAISMLRTREQRAFESPDAEEALMGEHHYSTDYCGFAYWDLACLGMGMSGSACSPQCYLFDRSMSEIDFCISYTSSCATARPKPVS